MPAEKSHNPIVTDEALDAARLNLLRRRISAFGITLGAVFLFISAASYWIDITLDTTRATPNDSWILLAIGGATLIVMFLLRRRALARMTERSLVWRTTFVVVAATLLMLACAGPFADAMTALARSIGVIGPNGRLGLLWPMLVILPIIHTTAALILPWRMREAAATVTVIAAAFAALFLIRVGMGDAQLNRERGMLASIVALLLLSGVPGTIVAALRNARFRSWVEFGVLREGHDQVQRELALARRLHDRHFPASVTDGPIRVRFHYEPMKQIGGDFVEIIRFSGTRGNPLSVESADNAVTIVVLDVTGHGIAAALAVNRLHAEIRRITRETPDTSPRRIIESLAKYVCLTMADDAMFATAAACRIESETGHATICSAGHPPILLVRATGSESQTAIEAIDSSTTMLGVIDPDQARIEEFETVIAPGDRMLIYTDGAFEFPTAHAKQLGVKGLVNVVRAAAARSDHVELLEAVASELASQRVGPPIDDTLLVEIRRVI